MTQQRLGHDSRDTWNARERCLGGGRADFSLRALSVRWAISRPHALSAHSEAVKPCRGVLHVSRTEDVDAHIRHGYADAADSGGSQRAVVHIDSFNQEIRVASLSSKTANLWPERALDDRCMKSTDGLPLNDREVADDVVPSAKAPALHGDTELAKEVWHTASVFLGISDDMQHVGHSVADHSNPRAHERVTNQQQLALSRSESA
jgi:hypothetical protein